jgi:serine/threonine-protein phosphatase PP1 catalytic subunit
MSQVNIDDLITKLMSIAPLCVGTSANLTEHEAAYLCETAIPIFQSEPVLLTLSAPITIVGDTHGQFHDLIRIFGAGHPPGTRRFLFLGDYVDRGRNGVETLCLLLAYKIKYRDSLFMLRGNHECAYINHLYGFYEECSNYWRGSAGHVRWGHFSQLFQWLPIAAVISDKIFCVHGGLSPSLTTLDEIRRIERPIEIPEEGLLCDLVWADPSVSADTWVPNGRGTSFCFGATVVHNFLAKFNFDLICRAHQAVMDGYDFPFGDDKSLITLFSAPNYCYEFMNNGAILNVDELLSCTFGVFTPLKVGDDIEDHARPGTTPRDGASACPSAPFWITAISKEAKNPDNDDCSGDENPVDGAWAAEVENELDEAA